jgi:hypothetical protein
MHYSWDHICTPIIKHYYLEVLSTLSILPRMVMPFEPYSSNLWFYDLIVGITDILFT